jgi:hypothetical protein
VGLEVPQAGDDLQAVVDGVASPAALLEDLPVFESGDDMFDAGSDAPVASVATVLNDTAGRVAAFAGDGVDAAEPPSPRIVCPLSRSWARVRRATMTSLRCLASIGLQRRRGGGQHRQ